MRTAVYNVHEKLSRVESSAEFSVMASEMSFIAVNRRNLHYRDINTRATQKLRAFCNAREMYVGYFPLREL